jgi:hypothetical protein
LIGGIFGVLAGLYLLGEGEDRFFAVYLLATCAVFIFIGSWYGRIARKVSISSMQPAHARSA